MRELVTNDSRRLLGYQRGGVNRVLTQSFPTGARTMVGYLGELEPHKGLRHNGNATGFREE